MSSRDLEPGEDPVTRAGYVGLIGYPNAGKSSLLNRLLEQKLSIVTSAAQTTRERVVGIDTRDDVQMIYVDTPGLVDPKYLLHRSMLQTVLETIPDVDVVVLILDGTSEPPEFAEEVLDALRRRPGNIVVAINKMDRAESAAADALERWSHATLNAPAVRISALSGEGVPELRTQVAERLPRSPFLYPADEISTQPVRFFVAELIRETVFELYSEEIPYSATAKVEEYREERRPLYIRATVFVERPTQKGILIGRGGSAIKELGRLARAKIEEFVGVPVYLDLWVKVIPRWRRDPLALSRLGFKVPPDGD